MRKDKLYLFTILAITLVFLLVSIVGANYFIKASANQLIEVQVETSKREANEIAALLDFQLGEGIPKERITRSFQQTITTTISDSWFISVFDWSGNTVCHPNVTELGQNIGSDASLLSSLKEKNNSDILYDLLVAHNTEEVVTSNSFEVVHIAPLKNSDLIVAANVNIRAIQKQMKKLKGNFYRIFLFMGILVIVLSSVAVRVIGSSYEKQLELKNSSLANEVINLSKLNTDLISYRKRKEKETKEQEIKEEVTTEKSTDVVDNSRKRILTYLRNELVPVLIDDIAYIYTENTITYIVTFDGKKSTSNASLEDMYSNLDATIFFRANRQFIISIAAIDKIIKYGKSQLKILVRSTTSEEIIISKNKAAEFKQWLNL